LRELRIQYEFMRALVYYCHRAPRHHEQLIADPQEPAERQNRISHAAAFLLDLSQIVAG
jgi:hypothetical protein